MTPDELGQAPLEVNGTTYWLTHHAAQRALDMGVPIKIIRHIIEHGERYEAPHGSKHQNSEIFRMGRVSVAVSYKPDCAVIPTVLWATVEAWREAEERAGRAYKGDEWTERALAQWLGADVHDDKPLSARQAEKMLSPDDSRRVTENMIRELPNGTRRHGLARLRSAAQSPTPDDDATSNDRR